MSKLGQYKKKRNFKNTPEPGGGRIAKRIPVGRNELRFVIQKHDATRLHYDFRLETKDGLLKSWAVPKGISLDPSVKRLAIMVEDHPGDYINFEGEIPKGNYGAGTVIVWDTGTYLTDKDIEEQIKAGKIIITLAGEKVKGSFKLVKTSRNDNQWLLIKSKDEYASPDNIVETMPESVLSGRTINPRTGSIRAKVAKSSSNAIGIPRDFPTIIKPMLAMPVDEAFDRDGWVFEVKWDGVRAIIIRNKSDGILRIQSRKGNDITHRYPEITSAIDSSLNYSNSIVLDGEIVVLNNEGIPDFQRHQARMNIDDTRQIARLSSMDPATYYVFDILYLDGLSLEQLDLIQRREILSKILRIQPSGGKIRISDFIEGKGKEIFRNAIAMKLEGIVAKYKYSKYSQGARSPAWLKIKGVQTQDCVIVGYTRGEGNRGGYFGSFILAVKDRGKLRFVGHSGSGLGFDQLEEALKKMRPLTVDKCPLDHIPYVNQKPVWLKPGLVVEVKFHGWTKEGIMRAPIFVRFRDDKTPEECVIETPKDKDKVIDQIEVGKNAKNEDNNPSSPSFSNLHKVFWPASPFTHNKSVTKGDLIDYYRKISSHILPHLVDRPLSLGRYPDGILGKSFYHKNWELYKPDYVKTIKVFSESSRRVINYLMCNNRDSLLWLANLGCIEMHPWYSRVHDFSACNDLVKNVISDRVSAIEETKCGLEKPDFIVFDLDPYVYSGKEGKGQEPEFNVLGFKLATDVAYELKDMLESLNIESYLKTSGKTGLHIFVPIAPNYSYDQTRTFAKIVGKMLIRKIPNKITMEWSTEKRKGKLFFDYNQNAKGKTIASVLSARPTASATVSMPIEWKKLNDILPTDFTMFTVPHLLKKRRDPWSNILDKKQDLARLMGNISEIA